MTEQLGPRADRAAEVTRTARALSESELSLTHPAEIPTLTHELHDTVDSLTQVAAQLAWWHAGPEGAATMLPTRRPAARSKMPQRSFWRHHDSSQSRLQKQQPTMSGGNAAAQVPLLLASRRNAAQIGGTKPRSECRATPVPQLDVNSTVEALSRGSRVHPFLAVVLPLDTDTHRDRGTVLERGSSRFLIADLLPVPPRRRSPINRFVHTFYYAPNGVRTSCRPKSLRCAPVFRLP